ncbi:hypothetical protein ABQF26_32865, partial [Mycolicibacterium elephantis]
MTFGRPIVDGMRRSLIIAVAALALLAAGLGGVVIATTGSAADHEPLGPITVRVPEQPSSPQTPRSPQDAARLAPDAPAAPVVPVRPPDASKLAPPPPPVDVP